MKQTTRILTYVLALGVMVSMASGCTVKASTNTSTDAFVNFVSSTTGKSWFNEDGLVGNDVKVDAFVAMNYESLKQDMARGKGEYLVSFGELLGIPVTRQDEFSELLGEQYTILIPSEDTTPAEMLVALRSRLKK